MTDKSAIRLALRQEGQWWNAYLALPDTMDGAERIGSIRMSIVTAQPELKQAFMALMGEAMNGMIRATFGVEASGIEVRQAPEHERAGNA